MPKLIMRGCFVRYADIRRDDESGMFTRIHFTCTLSDVIRTAMEWGEPGEGFKQGKLDGALIATQLVLTPNSKELKDHELQLDVNDMGNFEFFRVKTGEDSTELQLRFIVRSQVQGSGAMVEEYLRLIGKEPGQLRINYDEQAELDLATEEDKQDRLISADQAEDTKAEDAALVSSPRRKRSTAG